RFWSGTRSPEPAGGNFMRLADAEVEWFSSLSYHPATAPADQDHRGVGTRLCSRSRERAGSRRGRISAKADYLGSAARVNRPTLNADSAATTSDDFARGTRFGAASDKVVGRARLAPGAGADDEPVWRQYQLRRSAGRRRNYRARRGHRDSCPRSGAGKGAGTGNDQADSSHHTHALGSHSGAAVLSPRLQQQKSDPDPRL